MNRSHRRSIHPTLPGSRSTTRGIFSLLLASGITALHAPSLSAQASRSTDTLVVSDSGICDCAIDIERYITLSDPDGRAGLSAPQAIVRTVRGEYLLNPSVQQSTILLFNSEGSFERVVARPGQGPEEFGPILRMQSGPGDSIWVSDAGNGRITVLDPEYRVTRSLRWNDRVGRTWVTEDGTIVMMRGVSLRDPPADRLFVFTPELENIRSFLRSPDRSSDPRINVRRSIAVTESGRIAVAHSTEYLVEVWDIEGNLRRVIERRAPWFPPLGGYLSDSADRLRDARIWGVYADENDRIWVLVRVPGDSFEESLEEQPGILGPEIRPAVGRDDESWDTWVEVFDAHTGDLLASRRVDPAIARILGDGFVSTYREDEVGLPYVDIWRLTLVENRDGRARRFRLSPYASTIPDRSTRHAKPGTL